MVPVGLEAVESVTETYRFSVRPSGVENLPEHRGTSEGRERRRTTRPTAAHHRHGLRERAPQPHCPEGWLDCLHEVVDPAVRLVPGRPGRLRFPGAGAWAGLYSGSCRLSPT
ncbi:hypothetical protein Kpho02_32940 [Kitasatospora phosalacinea]|uniref:Uncharacterized protein n=1 Tax=Kitasatospora phosalacinea TaxID=2065 RepID=A0A9W6Q684_9ACTN|nr:hypothetical protein Kpho02_32940 [Kitasatospora phosalacinea]